MIGRIVIVVFVVVALGVALFAGLGNKEVLDARSEPGQIAALTNTFDLDECDDMQVLGAMYRDSSPEFTHRTAFSANDACIAELTAAARQLDFAPNDKGEFVSPDENGYQETVIFGEGGVIEWERQQK